MKRGRIASRGKNYQRTHANNQATKRAKHAGVAVLYPEGIGGREVCNTKNASGRSEYESRAYKAWLRDKHNCCLCGEYVGFLDYEFEHQDGRGMNGSKRDDRIEKDGKPYNGVAHHLGNSRKGSMTLAQYKAKYSESERRAICRGEA